MANVEICHAMKNTSCFVYAYISHFALHHYIPFKESPTGGWMNLAGKIIELNHFGCSLQCLITGGYIISTILHNETRQLDRQFHSYIMKVHLFTTNISTSTSIVVNSSWDIDFDCSYWSMNFWHQVTYMYIQQIGIDPARSGMKD